MQPHADLGKKEKDTQTLQEVVFWVRSDVTTINSAVCQYAFVFFKGCGHESRFCPSVVMCDMSLVCAMMRLSSCSLWWFNCNSVVLVETILKYTCCLA